MRFPPSGTSSNGCARHRNSLDYCRHNSRLALSNMSTSLRAAGANTDSLLTRSLRFALILFVAGRVLLSAWAAAVISLVPVQLSPDETLRPFLSQPALLEGMGGLLLGPWQRFDTMRYLQLATQGYSVENSVFPPLYPLAIRALGTLLQAVTPAATGTAYLLAAILIANAALLAALVLLYMMTTLEIGEGSARRTLTYVVFFPAGFFLFAAYSESLFLLFAIAALWSSRQDRPLWAGTFALLAALTRLTGWGLVLPLAYEYARRREFNWRRFRWAGLATLLPVAGLGLFLLWRVAVGMPALGAVYRQFWFQSTGMPGVDVLVALRSVLTGSGPRAEEFSLLLDLFSLLFIFGTTVLAFRHLNPAFALYSAALLLFMLLPTSDLKPLYSFSRYALAFFPSFMLLAVVGKKGWSHRLILYPSLLLWLFFSGQFFLWGWVA